MDLFSCQSTVEASISRFQSLAKRIFPKQKAQSSICNMLASWWSDGKYDSGVLEDVVRESFGLKQRLFDISPNRVSRIKIGVMATTSYDSRLCIFTNYHGVGQRTSDLGKLASAKEETSNDQRLRSAPS